MPLSQRSPLTALAEQDLLPVAQLDLTAPLVAAIVICLLLALVLTALSIVLSRPARRAKRVSRPGTHSEVSGKSAWHARIEDIVRRHAAGDLEREDAFTELAAVARDYASAASSDDLRSSTLTDIARVPRHPGNRHGLDMLRQTIEALYPPEFADAAANAQARDTSVEEAAGWVAMLVERWR